MHIVSEGFWLAKRDNSQAEYEDAFSPEQKVDSDFNEFHCAVADGATTTIFSGIWAKLLVEEFAKSKLSATSFSEVLPNLQKEWLSRVSSKELPWYAERKVQIGACAALVGLTIRQPSPKSQMLGSWECFAVGDSCLFQIRRNKIVSRFPITSSKAFDGDPLLISANPERNPPLADMVNAVCGTWEIDDYFFLMTDRIACWFMSRAEAGQEVWNIFRDLGIPGNPAFDELIADFRNSGLANDDVTVLVVSVT